MVVQRKLVLVGIRRQIPPKGSQITKSFDEFFEKRSQTADGRLSGEDLAELDQKMASRVPPRLVAKSEWTRAPSSRNG